MSRVLAYDFDGVLAEGPPRPPKPWRWMSGRERKAWHAFLLRHYAHARPLASPLSARFFVITARKEDPAIRAASRAWLEHHHPGRCAGLYMLSAGRTIENVLAFKACSLVSCRATDFYEDNPQVVRGLRAMRLGIKIWRYKPDGTCSLQ